MKWVFYQLSAHTLRLAGILAAGWLFRLASHHVLSMRVELGWVGIVAAGFALSESLVPEDFWYHRAFAALVSQGFVLNPVFTDALMNPRHCTRSMDQQRFRQMRHTWLLTEWHRVYILSHWALYAGFLSLMATQIGWWSGHSALLGLVSYASGWVGLGLHRRYLSARVTAVVMAYAADREAA